MSPKGELASLLRPVHYLLPPPPQQLAWVRRGAPAELALSSIRGKVTLVPLSIWSWNESGLGRRSRVALIPVIDIAIVSRRVPVIDVTDADVAPLSPTSSRLRSRYRVYVIAVVRSTLSSSS